MDNLPYSKEELGYFFNLKPVIHWNQSLEALEAIYNNLKLVDVSTGFENEFGTVSDKNEKNLSAFFDQNEPFAKACLEKTLDDGQFDIQFSENKGNGTYKYYLAKYSSGKDLAGKIENFSCIIESISIDQYYERKLRNLSDELNRRIEELHNINFTASHRIRSPLARILGLIELLKLEGKYDNYLEMLESSCRELDDEIRRFTKVLDDDKTLNPEDPGSKDI